MGFDYLHALIGHSCSFCGPAFRHIQATLFMRFGKGQMDIRNIDSLVGYLDALREYPPCIYGFKFLYLIFGFSEHW